MEFLRNIFLQTYPTTQESVNSGATGSFSSPEMASAMLEQALGPLIFMALIIVGIYLYLGITYMLIGRKAGLNSPGISWMPSMGPLAVIFEASKMHWWPWLLLPLGFLLIPLSMLLSPVFGGIVLFILMLAFAAMGVVWHWKTYEEVGKPGWWILIPVAMAILGILISLVGGAATVIGVILVLLGPILHLVLIGIAAWSKEESVGEAKPQSQQYYQNYSQ